MTARFRVGAAWLLLAVAGGGLVAAATLDSPPYARPSDIFWASGFLAFPIVGLVLTLKRPRNAVGWLFEAGPGLVLWGVAMEEAGVGEAGSSVFGLGLVMLLSAVILFPDGRYAARWFGYAHAAALVGIVIENRVSPETDGGLSLALLLLLAAGALVYRLARGGSTQRRQIMLPVLVAIAGLVGLLAIVLILEGASEAGSEDALVHWLAVLVFTTLTVGIPVAIGVSVLRYRLYDLDRLFARTVSYALVIAVLAAVYTGGVFLITQLLSSQSDLAVAASTLTAAALFNPLRRRIQRSIDRRFNRARYDAQRVVEEFSARLREEVDLEQLTADWVGVVQATMQPSSVSVWVRSGV